MRRALLFGLSVIIMLPALLLLALAALVLRDFLRFPDKLLAFALVAVVVGSLSIVSIGLTAWLTRQVLLQSSTRSLQ